MIYTTSVLRWMMTGSAVVPVPGTKGATMSKYSLLGAAVCAAALLGVNVSAASAQGQVERGPEHARSICSFSGLNDEPEVDGRVQSFGQLVRQDVISPSEIKSGPPSPGFFCNPNNLDLRDPGEGPH